ncbi:MAG: outer membrane beta-barrel protein [Steroidobacteraceae bacterium]
MHKLVPTRSRAGVVLAALAATGAHAAPLPQETLRQILANTGISASGYLAASYYDSSADNAYHQFDTGHDAFQLDQAGLTVGYQPRQGFGALLDVIAGDDAKIVNAAESASAASNNAFDLLQGYVQYVHGGLALQAGKFTTLAGAEVIAPTGNTNFSRSLLFYAEPMTHTGVRATYTANSAVTVIVGLNNGWNYTRVSSGSKTVELGLALNPFSRLSLSAQSYIGNDPVDLARRTLIDTVATYNATAALQFVLSYDWGRQDASAVTPGGRWSGVAAYLNQRLSRRWRVSLRGESLDDRNGFVTGTAQTLAEGTVTVGYDPTAQFELRLEGRYDHSNRPTFYHSHPAASTGRTLVRYSDRQSELAVQGVYSF